MRILGFISICGKKRFDAVVDFTGDFSGPVLLAAKFSGIGIRIAFYRGTQYQFQPTLLRICLARVLGRLTRASATKILSNSRTALSNFHAGWDRRQTFFHVVRNGIPRLTRTTREAREALRRNLGIPTTAFLVGHTGRYSPAKNHSQILKVAAELISRHPNVYFLLCGRGVKAALGNELPNHRIQDRCILLNSRDDVPELLSCMDAFYFPSKSEGMPNSLLEAMSLGIPFVASGIEPIREILPEAFLRYLVEPCDTRSAVHLLTQFIEDPGCFDSATLSSWTGEAFSEDSKFMEFLCHLKPCGT